MQDDDQPSSHQPVDCQQLSTKEYGTYISKLKELRTRLAERINHTMETCSTASHVMTEEKLVALQDKAAACLKERVKECEVTLQALESWQVEITEVLHRLQQVAEDKDEMLRHCESSSETLAEEEAELVKGKESSQTSTSPKLVNMERDIDFMREWMGIELKHMKDGGLRFLFKYINPREPNQVFSIQVKLEGESKIYIDCVPPVPELDEMIEELNRTNDFGSFVIEMRRKFKTTVH